MNYESRSTHLRELQNFLLCFENESDSSEDEDFPTIQDILKSEANANYRNFIPNQKLKHTSVQTAFDTDPLFSPWLLDSARKLQEFCIKLLNMLEFLLAVQNRLHQNKSNGIASTTASLNIINTGKSYGTNQNYNSESLILPFDKSYNPMEHFNFKLIQDTISSMLKSAVKLKNKISEFHTEKTDNINEEKIRNVKCTTEKETFTSKHKQSKIPLYKTGKLPKKSFNIKRCNTLQTVTEYETNDEVQRFKNTEPLNKIACRKGKLNIMCSPKKNRTVASVKDNASETKTTERKLQSEASKVPTKNTGAIPKTRIGQKAKSSNTSIQTRKTKSNNAKPQWK